MPTIPESAGLCHTCRHARLIVSEKGSRFVLCEASFTDKTLAKYPALPRIECHGYELNSAGHPPQQ